LKLIGFPFGAALCKDALEQFAGGFIAAAFFAGEIGLSGNQTALAGGLEHRGAIALQIALYALERGDSVIKACELLFDFGDNPRLLWLRSGDELQFPNELEMPAVSTIGKLQDRKLVQKKLRVECSSWPKKFHALCTDNEWLIDQFYAPGVIAENNQGKRAIAGQCDIVRVTTNMFFTLIDDGESAFVFIIRFW
jgi:hypothetical protein